MTIIFEISGGGEKLTRVRNHIGQFFDNMKATNQAVLREIASEFALTLKEKGQEVFTFPRSGVGLIDRIKIEKLEGKSYVVRMPGYARIVEQGRSPGRMPPYRAKLARWAALAGKSEFVLRKEIALRGTKARPFINPSLMEIREKARAIIKSRNDQAIRNYVK